MVKNSQYYCLVASLPELKLDMPTKSLDFASLRTQIAEDITQPDAKALANLYLFYDVQNIINAIKGNDMPHSHLGTLTEQEIADEIEAPEIDELPFQTKLPQQIVAILDRYKNRIEDNDVAQPIAEEKLENELWLSYYNTAAASSSKFIRIWSATDRSMRNIIAAEKARAYGIDPVMVMVGEGELEEQISSSTAADFGLRGEFDYFEQLWDVIQTEDMLTREHKIDALRWNITSELTDQNYFDLDFLAAYLVKLNILERWQALDKEVGKERFSTIVSSFTRDVKL